MSYGDLHPYVRMAFEGVQQTQRMLERRLPECEANKRAQELAEQLEDALNDLDDKLMTAAGYEPFRCGEEAAQ